MMMVEKSIDRIRNAVKRVRLFEPNLPDDCPLFIEGPDGSFRELLAHSSEINGPDAETQQLVLSDLEELLPKDPEKDWNKAWDRFDKEQAGGSNS